MVSTEPHREEPKMMLCHHECDRCTKICDRSPGHPGDHVCAAHAPQVTR